MSDPTNPKDDFLSIPDEYLTEIAKNKLLSEKRTDPEAAVQLKKELKDLNLYQVAANMGQDRDPKYMGDVERLLTNGDTEGLRALLGPDGAEQVLQLYSDASKQYEIDRDQERTTGQAVGDIAVGIPAGIINSVWGLGAMGVGALDSDAGAAMIRTNRKFNEKVVDALSSDALLSHRKVKEARDAKAEQQHADQIEAEANPLMRGDFSSELGNWGKRIVKDAASGAYNTVSDPTLLLNGVADTAASMAMAAGTTKVLGAVGQGAAKQLAARAAVKEALAVGGKELTGAAGKQALNEIALEAGVEALKKYTPAIERVAFAGSNFALEGGGAYQQLSDQILSTPTDQLLRTSKEYKTRVDQLRTDEGLPEKEALEKARNELAHKVAFRGGMETGVVAAALSDLIGGQGKDPLHVKSPAERQGLIESLANKVVETAKHPETAGSLIKEAMKETASETVEEFSQGYTGQLIANRLLGERVDPNTDPLAGVGRAAGEGAALAFASTGMMKAPDALRGGKMAAASGVKSLSEKVVARGEKIGQELEAQSVASVNGLNTKVAEMDVQVNSPEIIGNVKEVLHQIAKNNGTEAVKASIQAFTDLKDTARKVSEIPASIKDLSPEAKAQLGAVFAASNASRVDVAENTAKLLLNETDPKAKAKLALFLDDILAPARTFKEESDALAAFDESPKTKELINGFRTVLAGMEELPLVKKARAQALEALTKSVEASRSTPVTSDMLNSQTKERANTIASLALNDPGLVAQISSKEEIQAILKHDDTNDTLTEGQRKALDGAQALLEAKKVLEDNRLRQVAERAAPSLEGTNFLEDIESRHQLRQQLSKVEQVGGQATIETNARNHRDQEKPSARQIAHRVIGAMAAGNTAVARLELKHLANLTQNFQNKLEALNESSKTLQKTAYQQLLPNQGFDDSSTNPLSEHKRVFLNVLSDKSIALAQTVDAEANLLFQVTKGLAAAYPELGIPVPKQVRLIGSLQNVDPVETAKTNKANKDAAKRRKAEKAKKAEATATTKPAATEAQKVDEMLAKSAKQSEPAPKVEKVAEPEVKPVEEKKVEEPKAEPAPKAEDLVLSEAAIAEAAVKPSEEAQAAIEEQPIVQSKSPEEIKAEQEKAKFQSEVALIKSRLEQDMALAKHFNKSMSKEERLRTILSDPLTGLLNRTGAEFTPADPKRPFLAVFSVEGKKPLNDFHGHESLDGLLRVMARVLTKSGTPDGMKIGGDIQGFFGSLKNAEDVAAAMQSVVGPEFRIKVNGAERVSGESFDKLLKRAYAVADGALKEARNKGDFSFRKAPPKAFINEAKMPKGINWEYDASEGKTNGLDPESDVVKDWLKKEVAPAMEAKAKEFERQTSTVQLKIHPEARKKAIQLSLPDQLALVYRSGLIPGMLNQRGFETFAKAQNHTVFASLDMRSLKPMNKRFSEQDADAILQIFGEMLVAAGGDKLNAAHLHGDEFALSGMNPVAVNAVLAQFKQLLSDVQLYKMKKDGSLAVQDGISFAWGIGKDLKEADSVDLAKRKEADKKAGIKPSEPVFITDPELIKQRLAELERNENAVRFEPEPLESRVGGQTDNRVQETPVSSGDQHGGLPEASVARDAGSQQAEPVAAPADPKDLYPNLYKGPAGTNLVHEELKVSLKDGKPTSRLMGKTDSLGLIQNAVSSADQAVAFKSDKLAQTLNSTVSSAYAELLRNDLENGNSESAGGILSYMQEHLDEYLNKRWGAEPKDGPDTRKTIGQLMAEGSNIAFNETNDGKALNLVEKDANGNLQYNKELLSQATMAALQWAITASQRQLVIRDEDDIADEFGLNLKQNGVSLDPKLARMLSEGEGTNQAKRTLANTIRRFWGLQSKTDAGMGYSEGVVEATAAELLRAMEASGLVTVKQIKLHEVQPELFPRDREGKRGGKTVERFISKELTDTNDKPSAIYDYPELLEELAVTEPEKATFYKGEVPPVLKQQLSNPFMDTTEQSNKARENMQKQPFFANVPMIEWILALGEKGLLEHFGTVLPETDEAKNAQYNKNDLDAIEGQNKTLIGGFRELQKVYGQMKNIAGKDGDVSKLEKRYQYAVNSVNRIMMLGAHNPQANKLMRESLMSTWSMLDLSGENKLENTHYKYMMLALSQALGEKVHKKTFEENVRWGHEQISEGGRLAPVIEALTSWLESGKREQMPVAAIKNVLGDKHSMWAVMSLLEIARMRQMEKSGSDLKEFRTPMYLEADGMTNGPFNSMGLLSTGSFTPEWVANVSRGGLSFSTEPRTADQLFKDPGLANGCDIYKASADSTKNVLDLLRGTLEKGKKTDVVGQSFELFRALSILDGSDIKWAEDAKNVVIERGYSKNPITILIYGSGVKGVAGKLVSKFTEAFYSKMSLLAKAGIDGTNIEKAAPVLFPDMPADKAVAQTKVLFQALHELTRRVVTADDIENGQINAGSYQITRKVEGSFADRLGSPKDFTFSKNDLDALQNNFKNLLVNPLYLGIQQTLGKSVFDNGKLLIDATKLHSVLAETMYFRAINEKVAEKQAALYDSMVKAGMSVEEAKRRSGAQAKSEFLSKQELRGIWDDLRNILPILEEDGQSFLLAKTDRGADFDKMTGMTVQYSRALDGSMKTPPDITTIRDAGVSAIPYLTIGMGDGRMVRSLFESEFQNALQVFDGINIPVDHIAEYGPRINEAAARAFQANVFQKLAKTFNQAMTDDRVQAALKDPKFIERMASELKVKPSGAQIAENIRKIQLQLDATAMDMQARVEALKKIPKSMDQMSGTFEPFLDKGSLTLPENPKADDIARLLNSEREKELARLQAEQGVVKKSLPELFRNGTYDQASGVTVLDRTAFGNLIGKLSVSNRLTAGEKQLLAELFQSKALDEVKVVAGNFDQITKYQDKAGLSSLAQLKAENPGKTIHGYYSAGENTIYLMNPQVETLVHELVHAATFGKVQAYYDGKLTNQQAIDAVKRLEHLMTVFLKTEFGIKSDSELGTAMANAQREIRSRLLSGTAMDKAMALNEFMSWTLANRQLAEQLGNVNLTDNLSRESILQEVKALPLTGSPEQQSAQRNQMFQKMMSEAPSKLAKLTRQAWNAIRSLVWGPNSKVLPHSEDLLSNIRFNTAILVRSAPAIESVMRDNRAMHAVLAHSDGDPRLEQLDEAFAQIISRHLNQVYANSGKWSNTLDPDNEPSLAQPRMIAKETLEAALAAFPDMSEQAQFTFHRMVMAFATEAAINPGAMVKAQEIFNQVIPNLTASDFLTGKGDPQNDEFNAQRKLEFITGRETGHLKDAQKRSTVLPAFMALAAVNDSFRSLLATKALTNETKQTVTGPNTLLENLGTELMERTGERLADVEHQPANVRVALDQLTDGIVKSVFDERTSLVSKLEQREGTISRMINDGMVSIIQRAGLASFKKGDELQQSSSKFVQALGSGLKAMSFIADEKDAAVISEGILSQMDKNPEVWAFVRDLTGDLLGRVVSQARIYDMLKRVRTHVTQVRQMYREHVPYIIESKFKHKPTEEQWDSLHRFMGRYDMAALTEGRTAADALDLVKDPNALQAEMGKMESILRSEQPLVADSYIRKIEQYTNFVKIGIRAPNLLTNAYAIAELLGEKDQIREPSSNTVTAIDQLITLKLLSEADAKDVRAFTELAEREPEGISFTLNYLKGQRKDELTKAAVGMAKYNHYKGAISSINRQGHLTVVEDSPKNHRDLTELGYVRLGSYQGSNIDPTMGNVSRSYYYVADGRMESTFSQGIAQTIYDTAYGVKTLTGLPLEPNAGVIDDPVTVQRIAERMHREAVGSENLAPIYNQSGQITMFVRTLSPEKTAMLSQPQHLANAIGRWRGRQVEEAWATKVNDRLVEHLNEMYQSDIRENPKNADRYVNILDPKVLAKDPVLRDAVNLLPFAMRETAQNMFGDGKLFVRRNLVTTAIGHRQATIGDMWTGKSRFSKADQELIKNAAISFLGVNAYKKLIWAEKNWQAAMFSVRTNIVVRSLVVPAANFVSGLYQLRGRGVPMTTIVKGVPAKLREIEFYANSMAEKVRLEAELRSNEDRVTESRQIKAKLQALLDSQKRLSIWPLIEAGEFSTISDVGDSVAKTDENRATVIDKLVDAVDNLPAGLRDAAKQGYMARDTALFKALQKSVQYSDFIMKAIYYDHLLKSETKLLTETPGYQEKVLELHEQAKAAHAKNPSKPLPIAPYIEEQARKAMALGRITEEFVNYDLPTGRIRGYLENMGLAWFLNYKLRASKIALSMLRNNPFQALMMSVTPHIPGADTPISGNLFTKAFNGVLGYSVGPQMAVQPIALNPWYNLIAE